MKFLFAVTSMSELEQGFASNEALPALTDWIGLFYWSSSVKRGLL